MRRLMSYRKKYLRCRDRSKRVASFYKIIRILRDNFSRHFAELFQHFVIFVWTSLKNLSFHFLFFFGWEKRKRPKMKQGEKWKKNQNRAWVTNFLGWTEAAAKRWRRKKKEEKLLHCFFFQITQIKTSFPLLMRWQKIFSTKIKKESTKVFFFSFFISIFFLRQMNHFPFYYIFHFSTTAFVVRKTTSLNLPSIRKSGKFIAKQFQLLDRVEVEVEALLQCSSISV